MDTNQSLTGITFLLQVIVLHLTVACSPHIIPSPNASPSYPEMFANTFSSFDNTALPLRSWIPPHKIDTVIIAVHGFNDYSNFIKDAAPFLNQRKIALYSFDQRGFGQSETRGLWSGKHVMARDLATLISLIKNKHPDIPTYILGDSMGGAVTIVTMSMKAAPNVNGVILVAPAVWARKTMPLYQRISLWLGAHTIPWKTVTGQSLNIIPSDNIAMLRELGRDPLVIKETRIDVLYGLANLMDEAFIHAKKISNNCLLLYGQKDEIIPKDPIFDFYSRLPFSSTDRQLLILYENGYHMLLRDLQSEKVLQDIADWIRLQ